MPSSRRSRKHLRWAQDADELDLDAERVAPPAPKPVAPPAAKPRKKRHNRVRAQVREAVQEGLIREEDAPPWALRPPRPIPPELRELEERLRVLKAGPRNPSVDRALRDLRTQ